MASQIEQNVKVKQNVKVTADDYGYCPERNQGIIKALNDGIVNSVSVLVNARFVDSVNMIYFLKKADKKIKLGLHLNLTEGRPVTSFNYVITLLDHHDNEFFPRRLFQGKLNSFCKNQVYEEIKNQIVLFKKLFDKTPDYIDGHQHCHVFPIIAEELAKCMDEFDIRETRIPHELNLVDLKIDSCITGSKEQFFRTVLENCVTTKAIFDKYKIRYPCYFIGLSTMSKNMNELCIRQAISSIRDDLITHHIRQRNQEDVDGSQKDDLILELMTHPGYPCITENSGCSIKGPDEFAKSEDRLHELNFLQSEKAFKLILEMSDLINY